MAHLSETPKIQSWLARLITVLPALERNRRTEILDVRVLSDHLKRDMGFLDGLPTDKLR
jgi:hypothetical protein